MSAHQNEVSQGQRFEFGANWERFLSRLNPERLAHAERSLQQMLGVDSLAGKRFVDIGSGSGLFSLAARRLGAKVYSLDYDPKSVRCTNELRRRYFPDDADWSVAEGSVLDPGYLKTLGTFDVVYSWGVLHHTGAMWDALRNVVPLVEKGGQLFIAIYNDQGPQSHRWRRLKRIYNALPSALRPLYVAATMGPRELRFFLGSTLRGRPQEYLNYVSRYSEKSMRGMSYYHDVIDWIGGYPFEFAKPEEIFSFYHKQGFELSSMITCGGGLGCNEFVFRRAR